MQTAQIGCDRELESSKFGIRDLHEQAKYAHRQSWDAENGMGNALHLIGFFESCIRNDPIEFYVSEFSLDGPVVARFRSDANTRGPVPGLYQLRLCSVEFYSTQYPLGSRA